MARSIAILPGLTVKDKEKYFKNIDKWFVVAKIVYYLPVASRYYRWQGVVFSKKKCIKEEVCKNTLPLY